MSLWKVYDGKSKDYEQYKKKLPDKFKNLYPLRSVISGASGSGKTNLVKNLVFEIYKPVLKYVFLFSGTDTTISEFEELHKENTGFTLKTFDSYSDEKVDNLVEQLKDKSQPSLFIFDDLAYKNIMKKNKNNSIDRLYQTGRHYNINVIVTAQRYTQINPSSRQNNSNLVVVFNANKKELDMLFEEHGGTLTKEEFVKAYNDAVDKSYRFFAIDYTEKDLDKRYKDTEMNAILKEDEKLTLDEPKEDEHNDEDEDDDETEDDEQEERQMSSMNSSVKHLNDALPRPTAKKGVKLVKFKKADDGKHKMTAVFDVGGENVEVSFGDKTMKDYTQHKDRDRKMNYIKRHSKREDWTDPMSKGALSRWILWNTPDIKANIKLFKRNFKLS